MATEPPSRRSLTHDNRLPPPIPQYATSSGSGSQSNRPSLSFPRQQYSSPYATPNGAVPISPSELAPPPNVHRTRTPVGSTSSTISSNTTGSPLSSEPSSTFSTSPMASNSRFDMKRMLSKPATSADAMVNSRDSSTSQRPRLSRPRTAPSSSPSSSPNRTRFSESAHSNVPPSRSPGEHRPSQQLSGSSSQHYYYLNQPSSSSGSGALGQDVRLSSPPSVDRGRSSDLDASSTSSVPMGHSASQPTTFTHPDDREDGAPDASRQRAANLTAAAAAIHWQTFPTSSMGQSSQINSVRMSTQQQRQGESDEASRRIHMTTRADSDSAQSLLPPPPSSSLPSSSSSSSSSYSSSPSSSSVRTSLGASTSTARQHHPHMPPAVISASSPSSIALSRPGPRTPRTTTTTKAKSSASASSDAASRSHGVAAEPPLDSSSSLTTGKSQSTSNPSSSSSLSSHPSPARASGSSLMPRLRSAPSASSSTSSTSSKGVPMTPTALIANEQERARRDLEAYERQMAKLSLMSSRSKDPNNSMNATTSSPSRTPLHPQNSNSIPHPSSATTPSRSRKTSRGQADAVPADFRGVGHYEAARASPINYVPAGPLAREREFVVGTPPSGAGALSSAAATPPPPIPARSLARHATAPLQPVSGSGSSRETQQEHHRSRAATTGAETASNSSPGGVQHTSRPGTGSGGSTPMRSMPSTSSLRERVAANNGSASSGLGEAKTDWQVPAEWAREMAPSNSSSSGGATASASASASGTGVTFGLPGGSSSSLSLSREDASSSSHTHPNNDTTIIGAPTLVRKVSRKLSKRPRKLDLDGPEGHDQHRDHTHGNGNVNANLAAALSDAGRGDTTGMGMGMSMYLNPPVRPGTGSGAAVSAGSSPGGPTSGSWVDRPFVHGKQQVYESPLSSAQIVQQSPLATIMSGGSDDSTPKSATASGSGSGSGGSKLSRLIRKFSSPSIKESASLGAPGGGPRRMPSDLSNIPPVPALPASALAASGNTPPSSSSRGRDSRARHVRRTSSATDFGEVIPSSLSNSQQGSSMGSRGTPDGGSETSTPDGKTPGGNNSANNSGYFTRVFKRTTSASAVRSQSQTSSRQETDASSSSQRSGSAWSRPSTSSSHVGTDDYPDAYPSPAPPPVPELPGNANYSPGLGRKAHHAPAFSTSGVSLGKGATKDSGLRPPAMPASAPTAGPSPLLAASRGPRDLDVFLDEDEADPSNILDSYATNSSSSRSRSREPPTTPSHDQRYQMPPPRDLSSRSTNTIHADVSLSSSVPRSPPPFSTSLSHHPSSSNHTPSRPPIPAQPTTPKPGSAGSGSASGTGSLRRRLGSFSSHKSAKDKDKEKEKEKDFRNDPFMSPPYAAFTPSSSTSGKKSSRRPRTAGDTTGTSSAPGYGSSSHNSRTSSSRKNSSAAHDPSSPHHRSSKPKRWSFDATASGGEPSAQAVTVASFAELGKTTPRKKSASEKDRMWDELMRRSDRAPGGTLHASIEGGMTLASDDLA